MTIHQNQRIKLGNSIRLTTVIYIAKKTMGKHREQVVLDLVSKSSSQNSSFNMKSMFYSNPLILGRKIPVKGKGRKKGRPGEP